MKNSLSSEHFYDLGCKYTFTPGCIENTNRAVEAFNKAISLNSNYAEAYYRRGIAYYCAGLSFNKKYLDKAIADFTDTIRLKANHADAYFGRGQVSRRKGDLDQAIADFNTALNLNPNNENVYNTRGLVYKSKGDLDKAIADFNKTISLNPNHADAYNNRGSIYADKGDLDHTIADFDQAVSLNPKYLNPKHPDAYYNRGLVYKSKGDLDQAIADFSKVISLNPSHVDAYYNRGLAYKDKENLDQAFDDFSLTIRFNPNHADAYYNRGLVSVDEEYLDAAIADFNKALSLRPRDASSYYSRGVAYKAKGDIEKAIADAFQIYILDQKREQSFLKEIYEEKASAENIEITWKQKKILDNILAGEPTSTIVVCPKSLKEIFIEARSLYSKRTSTIFKLWFGFNKRFPVAIDDQNIDEKLLQFLQSDHELNPTSLKACVLELLPFSYNGIMHTIRFESQKDLDECFEAVLYQLNTFINGKAPIEEPELDLEEEAETELEITCIHEHFSSASYELYLQSPRTYGKVACLTETETPPCFNPELESDEIDRYLTTLKNNRYSLFSDEPLHVSVSRSQNKDPLFIFSKFNY